MPMHYARCHGRGGTARPMALFRAAQVRASKWLSPLSAPRIVGRLAASPVGGFSGATMLIETLESRQFFSATLLTTTALPPAPVNTGSQQRLVVVVGAGDTTNQ